jgi:tetratricopeptide (TPR) repeat protein
MNRHPGLRLHVVGVAVVAIFMAAPICAQTDSGTVLAPPPAVLPTAPDLTAMDSAFARARRLVVAGQTTTGRQIGDSILAATPTGTDAYGNALYGEAMLAPTADQAELDYQRIIVEYPLSPHAGDALLQLAQLERSRGDRQSAIVHLQRFLRENPGSPSQARTGLWLAQLLFEQNDDVQACGVLKTARAAAPAGDVELQNQMGFYSGRCAAALANAAADSTASADSIKAAAQANEGKYSVQLGAFATKAEAEKMVHALQDHRVDARVDGDRKPYRVRVGHYKTRTEAAQAEARFRKLGYPGFVTKSSEL